VLLREAGRRSNNGDNLGGEDKRPAVEQLITRYQATLHRTLELPIGTPSSAAASLRVKNFSGNSGFAFISHAPWRLDTNRGPKMHV
jgi:hypothetical protein